MGESRELTTAQWKEALERLRHANIPQVTFTGGEPTLRADLVELVEAAQWFVTRLNTNGRLLTPELCRRLYEASQATRLTQEELTAVLRQAVETAEELGMEIDFTSPGWLPEETLRGLGLHLIPSCGACLSNMAVTPGGQVVPCQSWLGGTTLGNLLADDWSAIWDGETCRAIRAKSAKLEHICQLGEGNREGC